MLADTVLNNQSWTQRTGRYETTDRSLRSWRLADADFAEGRGEHDGAWFLPVPGSGISPGQSGRYLLNVGGGNEFVVGEYDGRTNAFSNTSQLISTDFGQFSADWTAVGQANGRVLQVGWLSDYRLNPQEVPPLPLQALSLIRELFYDPQRNTLRAVPPVELKLLRNGSLGTKHATLTPDKAPVLVVAGEGGSAADIEATFALQDGAARFGLAVFCPPTTATNRALSACTKLTLDVTAVESGARSATMSVAVPQTPFVNATNATSAEFSLSGSDVRLRVLTDRNVVEGFGADGLASVSVLTFPAFADTSAFAFADAGSASVRTVAHSMGCQWLEGSGHGRRLKTDDGEDLGGSLVIGGEVALVGVGMGLGLMVFANWARKHLKEKAVEDRVDGGTDRRTHHKWFVGDQDFVVLGLSSREEAAAAAREEALAVKRRTGKPLLQAVVYETIGAAKRAATLAAAEDVDRYPASASADHPHAE